MDKEEENKTGRLFDKEQNPEIEKEIQEESFEKKENIKNTEQNEEESGEIIEVKEEKKENEEKLPLSAESLLNRTDSEINKKQNSQIKWAVFLMVAILLIILVVPFVKTYFNKFDYKGLGFQKTSIGDLIFYSAKFPVVSETGQVIGDYAINLRNDPRDLEYIEVNVSENKIKFAVIRNKFGKVYISLNPFMKICEDSGIALLTFSGFLADSGLEVKSAITDKAYAEANNKTQKWCTPFETVIIVTDGNETAIEEIDLNCYKVSFKDCEILQATERFELIILEEYASRFISS